MSQKQVIVLIGIIVIFVGVLHGLKKSDFISEKARVLGEREIQQLWEWGQPVTVKKASLSFFPPSVILSGIISTGNITFSTEEARVSFSLWSLLTQSIVIQEIRIQNPALSITESFQFKKKKTESSVIIRKIGIADGSFMYKTAKNTIFLSHIDAKILPDFAMKRFDIAFSGKNERLDLGEVSANGTFGGAVIIDDKETSIKKLEVVLNKTGVNIDGVIKHSDASSDTLNIKVSAAIPIEEYLPLLPVPHLPPLSGNLNLKGTVRGTVSQPAVTGEIGIPRLLMKTSARNKRDSPSQFLGAFKSDFSYDNKDKKLMFNKIAAQLFSGELAGEAVIGFPSAFSKKGQYRVKLQYDQLAVNEMLALGLSARPPLQPTGDATGSQWPGRWSPLLDGAAIKGTFLLEGGGTQFTTEGSMVWAGATGRSPLHDGKMVWTGSEKEIRFHQATVSFQGGKAVFPGTFRPKEGLALKIQIDSDEIKSVAETVNLPITGQLHLTGSLSGDIQQPFFSGNLQLHDWTLRQHRMRAFQTKFFYLDKTILVASATAPSGTANQPAPAVGEGIIRLGKVPAYYFTSEITSVDPQEVLRFFRPAIPLTTKATGRLLIEGEGARLTVHGPLRVAEGTLYGESFKKGSLLLHVTEKKVQIQNVRLEKGNAIAQGEGEISYRGDYLLKVTSSHIPIEKIDLLQTRIPDLSGVASLTVRGKGSIKKPQFKFFVKAEKLRYQDTVMNAGTIEVDWNETDAVLSSSFSEETFSLSGKMKTAKPFPFSFQSGFKNLPLHAFLEKETRSLREARSLQTKKSSPLDIALYADGKISGEGVFDRIREINLTSHLTMLSARWGDYRLMNDGPIAFHAKAGAFSIKKGSFKGTNTDLIVSGGLTPLKEWGLLVRGTADLNLLRLFTQKVRSGKGTAQIDLSINDRWEDPKIQGLSLIHI